MKDLWQCLLNQYVNYFFSPLAFARLWYYSHLGLIMGPWGPETSCYKSFIYLPFWIYFLVWHRALVEGGAILQCPLRKTPESTPPPPTASSFLTRKNFPQVLSPVFRQPLDIQDGGVHGQSCSSGKFLSLSSSCSETWPIIFHRILTIGGWKTGQSIGGGGRWSKGKGCIRSFCDHSSDSRWTILL